MGQKVSNQKPKSIVVLDNEVYKIVCKDVKHAPMAPLDLIEIGLQNLDPLMKNLQDKNVKKSIIQHLMSEFNKINFNVYK